MTASKNQKSLRRTPLFAHNSYIHDFFQGCARLRCLFLEDQILESYFRENLFIDGEHP